MRRASFAGLNGGDFRSEGAAEGGCGGNSAAPERSAGAKRRRSVPLKVGSSKVQNIPPPNFNLFIFMQRHIKKLLNSPYRKELWKNSREFIKKIEKVIPVSSVYLLGSFTTKKKRPADVDFILLLKTKKNANTKWSVDVVFAPDNRHGNFILEDARKWMKQKYGSSNSAIIRLK